MAKKPHQADIDNRAKIAEATEFSVFQYRHRNRYVSQPFGNLREAALHAAEVEHENPARPCLIYGYVDGVAHPVPDDLRRAALA